MYAEFRFVNYYALLYLHYLKVLQFCLKLQYPVHMTWWTSSGSFKFYLKDHDSMQVVKCFCCCCFWFLLIWCPIYLLECRIFWWSLFSYLLLYRCFQLMMRIRNMYKNCNDVLLYTLLGVYCLLKATDLSIWSGEKLQMWIFPIMLKNFNLT
jgi:hypothetical protein